MLCFVCLTFNLFIYIFPVIIIVRHIEGSYEWGTDRFRLTLISGFRRDVDEIRGLLGNYTASCGNYIPTFRDNVSIPSSRVKIPSRKAFLSYSVSWPVKMGPIRCPETSVKIPSRKAFLSNSVYWPGKMGTISCPETSVNNYHTTPCNYPEDHGFQV
jgi:hypothetical protein